MPRDQFNPSQAQEVAVAFATHSVDYMFIGKSGAILLGYPGTTQDVVVFPLKDPDNGRRILAALKDLGFSLDDTLAAEIIAARILFKLSPAPSILILSLHPTGLRAMRKRKPVWIPRRAFLY